MDQFTITAAGLTPAANGLPHINPVLQEDEVQTCRAWLRAHAKKRKTFNRTCSSYGLKHAVEEWKRREGEDCYVSNGAFIEAARREGYRIKRTDEGSPNAFFDMSWPKNS